MTGIESRVAPLHKAGHQLGLYLWALRLGRLASQERSLPRVINMHGRIPMQRRALNGTVLCLLTLSL